MRTDEQISAYRMKYGYGGVYCKICGMPTDCVALRCERCMESLLHGDRMEQVRRWFKEHPGLLLESGHDKKKLLHLVLPFKPYRTGFCGAHVSQAREKRKTVEWAGFPPPGFCDRCVEVYEGLVE